MEIIRTKKELQKYLSTKNQLGLVPTMGSLHRGHLSLVEKSITENHHTLVTIFVNLKQFSPNEDFKEYPRNLEKDLDLLKKFKVAVFCPSHKEIYPHQANHGYTYIGNKLLENLYCGKTRPFFFNGVLLIVLKLFNLINPQHAYFGKKDFQQFFLIKEMIKDLNLKVKVKAIATVRNKYGLALSSRNLYLDKEELEQASFFYQSLIHAKTLFKRANFNSPKEIEDYLIIQLKKKFKIDYLKVVDKKTLLPSQELKGLIILGAIYINKVRLIDNLEI